jgi:hypothetical protein
MEAPADRVLAPAMAVSVERVAALSHPDRQTVRLAARAVPAGTPVPEQVAWVGSVAQHRQRRASMTP